jgi:FixJ family two-component response regulator
MTKTDPVVFVIDDEESIREALKSLIRSVGLRVETFASAQEYLSSELLTQASCLVLDVKLPGLSGLELQKEMDAKEIRTPVIFITGHGDIPMTVEAMKGGAIEFLEKPFADEKLLKAITEAIDRDRLRREEDQDVAATRKNYEKLTKREREVMELVVRGMLNKQIAGEIGRSEITVKLHRHQVMEKMGAESVADLVRMSEKIAKRDRK